MTDWSKFKVTELKDACKERDISLTGVKLKQQYIDKLQEYEAKIATSNQEAQVAVNEETEEQLNGNENTDETKPADTDGVVQQPVEDQVIEAQSKLLDTETLNPPSIGAGEGDEDPVRDAETAAQPESRDTKDGLPTDSQSMVEDEISSNPPERHRIDNSHVEKKDNTSAEPSRMIDQAGPDSASNHDIQDETPQLNSESSAQTSSQLTPREMIMDQASRKRRSASPIPNSTEVMRKRIKANDSTAIPSLRDESMVKSVTSSENKTVNEIQINGHSAPENTSEQQHDVADLEEKSVSQNDNVSTQRQALEERTITPAIHSATSSLYFRNFKRPLHIPTLRSHIESLARSPASSQNSDPIKVFYLDSIRTHAFMTFDSVSAASRVRTAMHETRFPDESMREPLFVDFIPDDKVQDWIDQETNNGASARFGNGKKYEIVYEELNDGVVAKLQNITMAREQQMPESTRNARVPEEQLQPQRRTSELFPDRSTLDLRNYQNRSTKPDRPSESKGTGFKALDELFSSTTAKPKLYFKPVPPDIANERLSMIQGLRLDQSELGKSGDEGMKRYSFEMIRGREEWIDKGPEFGFGRKGQDRLRGPKSRGGGFGSFRGRFSGGDSWRSR